MLYAAGHTYSHPHNSESVFQPNGNVALEALTLRLMLDGPNAVVNGGVWSNYYTRFDITA
jgi:hypothetical protein